MKRKKYKQLSGAAHGLVALALAVYSGSVKAQTTYTFNHTGSSQTISLPAGNYSVECWGADGGKGFQTNQIANNGKGGYSSGILTLASSQTLNIYVGGKGTDATGSGAGQVYAGGFNGGGNSGANNYATVTQYRAGGGGGGTDVRVGGAAFTDRVIVAGGGGGGVYTTTYPGGNGGGTSGGNGGNTYHGDGGTQTAGGLANGSTGNIAGTAGALGVGGNGGTATSKSGGGGGGGGYYGGGGGATGNSTSSQGGGGGGSGYIGGVTSGTTIMFGQTGFVTNPETSGDGFVRIKELCSISLTAAGAASSVTPILCSGQSLTLTTDAVSNFSWSTGATTANSIVVSPTTNTFYTVSGTSTAACNANASITVMVDAGVPVISISATTNSICLGDSVSINATGATSYTYSGGISANTFFYPTATGNYSVTGANTCGSATSFTTVTVSPLPVAAVANPTIVCAGSPVQLTAMGAQNYTWLPGTPGGSNIVVSPMSAQVYTVIGQDGPCAAQTTVEVQTLTSPTVNIAASASVICSGRSATLTLTGADTYTWSDANLGNSTNVVVTPTSPTAYNVIGTNSLGCTGNAQQIVLVSPSPTVVTVTSPSLLCVGGTATLSASGADTYVWSDNSTTNFIQVSPVTTTTYFAIGTNTVNGCVDTAMVMLGVYQATISVSANMAICPGDVALLTAGPATSYTWATLGNQPTYTVSPAATKVYSLSALKQENGQTCAASNTVLITVNTLPNVSISASADSICKNQSVSFTAGGANTYKWSNGATSPSFTLTALTLTPFSFTVTGTDANGCKNTASKVVPVSLCEGIAETQALTLRIYPNPSTGAFTIDAPATLDVTIYNELGQAVKFFKDVNGSLKVDQLSKGIYLVEGRNSSMLVSARIVVE